MNLSLKRGKNKMVKTSRQLETQNLIKKTKLSLKQLERWEGLGFIYRTSSLPIFRSLNAGDDRKFTVKKVKSKRRKK
tara:strand:+ start:635 stop:865 length:231 start_codon:yes stop_codon:yes gene_type:complete